MSKKFRPLSKKGFSYSPHKNSKICIPGSKNLDSMSVLSIPDRIHNSRTPESQICKSPDMILLNTKSPTKPNLFFFPMLSQASRSRIKGANLSDNNLSRKATFKSSQRSENNRYSKSLLEENESCKDINFVSTPPDEENRHQSVSPFNDLLDRDLDNYMNPMRVYGKLEGEKNSRRFFYRENSEQLAMPPPFSISSKIIRRRRLRKLKMN